MCLYPILIKNPKYKENKKNGGNVPEMRDKRVEYIPAGCGECMVCRRQKARAWHMRLCEEIKTDNRGVFVTLTFNNEEFSKLLKESRREITKKVHRNGLCCRVKKTKKGWRCYQYWQKETKLKRLKGYNIDYAVSRLAIRRWLERWRKETGRSVKHWLVTELGHNGTENIHMHGIIWCEDYKLISKTWKYGYVWDGVKSDGSRVNYVNEKTISYITKYMLKVDEKHKAFKSKVFCSKGIGSKWCEDKKQEFYRTNTGHKISLCMYYKNKMYNDEEREELWLKKLDEGVRYIGKSKFRNEDVSEIMSMLEFTRRKSIELGYRSKVMCWKAKEYEEQLREINSIRRIRNGNASHKN